VFPHSYAHQSSKWLPRRSTTLLLALCFICSASTGCSSQPSPPLTVAFGGINYVPDEAGLTELLRRLPGAPVDEQINSLRALADALPNGPLRQKASYVLARLLQKQSEKKDLEEAAARFTAASELPALSERSQLHLADVAALLGDQKLVRKAQEVIVNSKTASPKARAAAMYAIAQSFLAEGDQSNARQSFEKVTTIAADSQYALGSSYYLADMDLKSESTATAGGTDLSQVEKRQQAINQFRNYLKQAPDGRFAEDIVMTLENVPGGPTAQDHSLFAAVKFARGHHASALEHWRKAGNTSEWYKQAVCLMRTGKGTEGKALLLSGIKNHANDSAVVDAATRLAKASNRVGAVAVWNTVLALGSRYDDVALYNLAIRAPSNAAALPYYAQIVSKYPNSTHASDANWWLAWSELEAGSAAKALPQLEAGANRFADTRAGAKFAYWIGKVHEKAGHKELAKAAYRRTADMQPWNYYAYRAEARIAALSGGKDEGWRTNPNRRAAWSQDVVQQWSWPEPPAKLAAEAGDTIAVLTDLGQWDECLELVPANAGHLRAFYLAKLGRPLPAINAATTKLKGKPEKTELWELAYPLLHAKLIAQAGSKNHVDPLLVQALIREESRYNSQAVSSSNALGLMQLLPGTAYGVAKRIGIKIGAHSDIHDVGNNIRLGTDYLSYVHQRHNGNSLFAVASYNGGPNAVARWAQHMPADTDVFVENIPFRETRDYVRKVFSSYWNYRKIYTNDSPAPIKKPVASS